MTTTVTKAAITAAPLTADDLAAWRLATNYSLHTGRLDIGAGSMLRLYVKQYGDPVIFTAAQQRLFPEIFSQDTRTRNILVNATAAGYGDTFAGANSWKWPTNWAGAEHQEPIPSCFYSGYNQEYFKTIVRALRVGSVLTLRWTADNNTEIARKAGLHLDEVDLVAENGTRKDVWQMGHAAGYDNSARMIRRER